MGASHEDRLHGDGLPSITGLMVTCPSPWASRGGTGCRLCPTIPLSGEVSAKVSSTFLLDLACLCMVWSVWTSVESVPKFNSELICALLTSLLEKCSGNLRA